MAKRTDKGKGKLKTKNKDTFVSQSSQMVTESETLGSIGGSSNDVSDQHGGSPLGVSDKHGGSPQGVSNGPKPNKSDVVSPLGVDLNTLSPHKGQRKAHNNNDHVYSDSDSDVNDAHGFSDIELATVSDQFEDDKDYRDSDGSGSIGHQSMTSRRPRKRKRSFASSDSDGKSSNSSDSESDRREDSPSSEPNEPSKIEEWRFDPMSH